MKNDVPVLGDCSPADGTPVISSWETAARVAQLLDVVQRFATLDFSEPTPVGVTGDDLDALAAGVNMLGEELQGWNADFTERVVERTTQLTAASEQLQAEVAERRRAEQQLAQANADLNDTVGHLRRLNRQIVQLTEMSNLLQSADDQDAAFDVVARCVPDVLPGASGAIYVPTGTGTTAELVRSWGPEQVVLTSISADGCVALRTGAIPSGSDDAPARCSHLPGEALGNTLCIPLIAQGETLGLLSLYLNRDSSRPIEGPQNSRHPPLGLEPQRLARAAAEQIALTLANLALRKEMHTQSTRDALTGLYNRRFLDESLARELHRAERKNLSVSVLMLDIDHFKAFNDTHGHAAGDTILSEVARILLDNIRNGDIACRYGGEEFVVIMTGADEAKATTRAGQICSAMALHAFHRKDQPSSHLTVSIGVATRPQHATSPDSLLLAADTALYRAKDGGRNQVATATN